jgi:hypothetical protein
VEVKQLKIRAAKRQRRFSQTQKSTPEEPEEALPELPEEAELEEAVPEEEVMPEDDTVDAPEESPDQDSPETEKGSKSKHNWGFSVWL